MKTNQLISVAIVGITLVMVFFVILVPTSFAAGLGSAEGGRRIGAIVGLFIGTIVMFRVHPILGVLTLIGGIAAISRY